MLFQEEKHGLQIMFLGSLKTLTHQNFYMYRKIKPPKYNLHLSSIEND